MKKIINKIILAFIFMFVSITIVDAAGANLTASTNSCYVGDTVTLTISYSGGAWDLYLGGPVTDSVVGYDANAENTSGSKNNSFTPSSAGTYTFTLTGTVTDAATDVTSNINQSVTVTVSERPAPAPEPQPQPQPTPQPSPQPSTPSNPTPSQQQEQKEEQKQEEKKEEPKEDPIVVENIEVVGFNIDFNEKKTEYELELGKNVTSIYLTTKSNGEASLDGIVDVKDKKEITITFKKGSLTKDYKIKFTSNTKSSSDDTTTTGSIEDDSNTKKGGFNIFIITTIVFGLTTLILLVLLIKSKKSGTKKSNKVELDKPVIYTMQDATNANNETKK